MAMEDSYLFLLEPEGLQDKKAGITADEWKDKVRALIREVDGKPVGNMLLRSIRRYGKWVKVRPYYRANPDDWEPSLRGHERNPRNAEAVRVTEQDGPYPVMPGRQFGSLVRISPERYAEATPCCAASGAGNILDQAHEVFFHELVHVLRHVSENNDDTKLLPGLVEFTKVEEFIAIMVTNIYASANGRVVLRFNHRGRKPLPAEFADPFGFYELGTQTYSLVQKFYIANRDFCALLTTVKARHNPIWAYYKDAERAKRCSQSAKARTRDRLR